MLAFKIAGAVLSTAAVLLFVWLVIEVFMCPEVAANREYRQPRRRDYARVIGEIFGAGILAYGAIHNALWWMPWSWGGHDEDGDWAPLRTTLSTFAAILLAGALVMWLQRHAANSKRLRELAFLKSELAQLARRADAAAALSRYERALNGDFKWAPYHDLERILKIDREVFGELSEIARDILRTQGRTSSAGPNAGRVVDAG